MKTTLGKCARNKAPGRIRINRGICRGETPDHLIDILLHEMIHLDVDRQAQEDEKDHHGPRFEALMTEINSTHGHSIRKEFNTTHIEVTTERVQKYRWRCDSCDFHHKRAHDSVIPSQLTEKHRKSGCEGQIYKLSRNQVQEEINEAIRSSINFTHLCIFVLNSNP